LEESEFKIHKTDTVSVTISDQLMGTTVFTVDMEEPIRVVKQFDSTLKYVLFTIVCVCGGEPKTYLPTYPPLLSMGRPTAIKDIFKSGLTPKDVF
jgi:hypothetical protein